MIKIKKKSTVYVISNTNKPLMPTQNGGKVRILLKTKRAKVVSIKPFTIQLLYDTPEITESLVLGLDTGRDFISATVVKKSDGEVLYSSELTTRNREVPKLMKDRKMHRQGRRRHRRQNKVRLARRNKTTYAQTRYVIGKGTEKGIPVKYIKKKPARFSNRTRPAGWLTPTANHLKQTHINYLKKILRILPVTEIVVEYAKFDTQKLDNPYITGEQYQQGVLFGHKNRDTFIVARQEGKCLMHETHKTRKAKIEHFHHIKLASQGGSEHHSNIAGLCKKCHDKVHKNAKFKQEMHNIMAGQNKVYQQAGILNSIMPSLYKEIQDLFGVANTFQTYGYITQGKRKVAGLKKSHCNDSYIIALENVVGNTNININQDITPYNYKQFRRHNRKALDAVRERNYKDGELTIAQNRNMRTDQEKISLKEYRDKLRLTHSKSEVDKIVSTLKVVPGSKRYRTKINLIPIPYGSVVKYTDIQSVVDGALNKCVIKFAAKRCVVSGVLNKGETLRLVDFKKTNISLGKCKLLLKNTGIVCI